MSKNSELNIDIVLYLDQNIRDFIQRLRLSVSSQRVAESVWKFAWIWTSLQEKKGKGDHYQQKSMVSIFSTFESQRLTVIDIPHLRGQSSGFFHQNTGICLPKQVFPTGVLKGDFHFQVQTWEYFSIQREQDYDLDLGYNQ